MYISLCYNFLYKLPKCFAGSLHDKNVSLLRLHSLLYIKVWCVFKLGVCSARCEKYVFGANQKLITNR